MTTEDGATWEALQGQEQQWFREAFGLWESIEDKEAVLKEALQHPHQRETALHLLFLLDDHELLRHLFSTLIDLVSVGHADVALCRSVIKIMDREWVVAHVEREVLPLLRTGADEEFRRIAELYAEIDRSLLARHVQRSLSHADPNVREVGQDFQELLGKSSGKEAG